MSTPDRYKVVGLDGTVTVFKGEIQTQEGHYGAGTTEKPHPRQMITTGVSTGEPESGSVWDGRCLGQAFDPDLFENPRVSRSVVWCRFEITTAKTTYGYDLNDYEHRDDKGQSPACKGGLGLVRLYCSVISLSLVLKTNQKEL